MGHATANNLLTNFIDVINNTDSRNHMIQASMDGPSSYWKFYKILQKDRLEKEQHELINIGSCSMHIIHGAFKTGVESFSIFFFATRGHNCCRPANRN